MATFSKASDRGWESFLGWGGTEGLVTLLELGPKARVFWAPVAVADALRRGGMVEAMEKYEENYKDTVCCSVHKVVNSMCLKPDMTFDVVARSDRRVGDADSSCAGEKAPNSRWSRRCFRQPSYWLFLVPEIWKRSNSIDW